jgi:GDP-D-mannose dehydratase
MGDVDFLVSDISKMTSELAFRPEHDIVSMIKSME